MVLVYTIAVYNDRPGERTSGDTRKQPMALTLRWREKTELTVEGAGLDPGSLGSLSSTEVALKQIPVGNTQAELGDLFALEGDAADGHLVIEGNLKNVRRIGQGMASGRLTVKGNVGPEAGSGMSGGSLTIHGDAGPWAGAEMRGGILRIHGNAGDFVGAAYPGSRLGMKDGVILVDGNVGEDVGLSMRRGLIAIMGGSGDGLGRGMVAGSIFAFGAVGKRLGAGMKRGTLALFGKTGILPPGILPTFVASGTLRPPFLSIYLKQLKEWGFPIPEATFSGTLHRYNGDLVEGGQGEILVWS